MICLYLMATFLVFLTTMSISQRQQDLTKRGKIEQNWQPYPRLLEIPYCKGSTSQRW